MPAVLDRAVLDDDCGAETKMPGVGRAFQTGMFAGERAIDGYFDSAAMR